MTEKVSEIIKQLKEQVRYRCNMMALPFDETDIEAHEFNGGHYLVGLMWLKMPDPERGGTKFRNIGLPEPPPRLTRFTPTENPFEYTIQCYVPTVTVRNPFVFYTVAPDGSYETGPSAYIDWFEVETKRHAKEDMEWAVQRCKERVARD